VRGKKEEKENEEEEKISASPHLYSAQRRPRAFGLLNHGARHDFSGPKSLIGIASTKKKLSIPPKKIAPMESVSTKSRRARSTRQQFVLVLGERTKSPALVLRLRFHMENKPWHSILMSIPSLLPPQRWEE
jgi:hypothetical protein